MKSLDENELRQLIADHKIIFEGPLPPQEWPSQYANTFERIRDIDRVRFDEFHPNETRELLTVAKVKSRVVKINNIAYQCTKNRANEQEWRLKLEHWIVARFDAQVVCHNCSERMWISEVQTLPDDPNRAEELSKRRSRRVLCTCSPLDRARLDVWERGQTGVFADRAERFVLHDGPDDLRDSCGKKRRPDRVFGLENTIVFDQYITARRDGRHSPFADGKALYPFLIMEVKSEKGSPGFEAVECQTAFPIRTLLQLQAQLGSNTGIGINPLVWFFANQGAEWRVYAAVVDGAQFRVFDLWHGTILSRDCTLQLLLIVDCICDWARDTYRLDILRCLSGGQIDSRAITPANSISTSQNEQEIHSKLCSSDSTSSSSTPQTATPTLEPLTTPAGEEIHREIDSIMLDIDFPREDAETPSSISANEVHPFLRYDKRHPDAPVWSKNATIQHSNFVEFVYRHCSIPEDMETLRTFLNAAYEADELAVSAKKLLTLFEYTFPHKASANDILALEELWIGRRRLPTFERTAWAHTHISFRTHFDSKNWQTVRVLECFTCSEEAEKNLGRIAGRSYQWQRPTIEHVPADLCTFIEPLRTLHCKGSMVAAMLNLDLQLDLDRSEDLHTSFPCWHRREGSAMRAMFEKVDVLEVNEQLRQHVNRQMAQQELLPTASGVPWLDSMLETQSIKGEHGAIVLRKPGIWPESCPFFCLVVFDPVIDLGNTPSLGRRLAKVLQAEDIYRVTDGSSRPRKFGEVDSHALNLWSNILQGSAPAEVAWPAL